MIYSMLTDEKVMYLILKYFVIKTYFYFKLNNAPK